MRPSASRGNRVVLDQAQLRPAAQAGLPIEHQAFEPFFSLDREALEVETNALIERAARAPVGGNARQRHRHQ